MADLRDVLIYMCQKYPYREELSNARLTRMVYLADWRSAITRGRQLTAIQWRFNRFGPYTGEILEVAASDKQLEVIETLSMWGAEKELIRTVPAAVARTLEQGDRAVLDHVIRQTAPLYWNDLVRMVSSTYPMLTKPRDEPLNLVELAEQYKPAKQRILAAARRDATGA